MGHGAQATHGDAQADLDWLREHTRYLQRATEWDTGGRAANRLLSGPDISAAKAWAARRPKNAPEPTALQLDFIKASEAEALRQQNAETQRLREIAEAQAERGKAQAERGKALAERESALEREAEARQSEAEAQKREAQQATARATAEANLRIAAEASARKLRQRLVFILAAAAIAAMAFLVSLYEARRASEQAAEAQRQHNRVNQARAQSIVNDLGLDRALEFGPREREALWKLAIADEPVKREFVSILVNIPKELIRVSPGFAQISRALGLLRPTPTEAETLIAALVRELRTTDEQRNARSLEAEIGALVAVLRASPAKLTDAQVVQLLDVAPRLDAFQALAPELTEAQAGQALDQVLKQFSQATNPNALAALAEALQALAPKLAEAEAVQALTIVLKQITQTTNPAEFGALGHASEALAPKLSEPQSSQALDPVLKQIAQTTNPYALLALAQTLRALPVKLTEEQAGQAIKPVLTQIGPTTDPEALDALAEALLGAGTEAERDAGAPGA